MESCNGMETMDSVDQLPNHSLRIIRHPLYQTKSPPWFDLRVFYVRVSNFEVDNLTPEQFKLNYIPFGPETILEVNGRRSSAFSECVSSQLRRDRVDKNSEEATFVNTDSIKMSGSVRFEVYERDNIFLSGVLELHNGNGFMGELKNHDKKWGIKCQSHLSSNKGFLKGKPYTGSEIIVPTIEVYVAGSFSGSPIILTKILQPGLPKKNQRKVKLDSIPEYESTELNKDMPSNVSQLSDYKSFKQQHEVDDDCSSSYLPTDYIENEDGELSWFNAGVRVGVGIGLGICVGVGLGVGLLVSTYQSTSRNFRRRYL